MLQISAAHKMYWVLRIASAMCFIGHGAFGIITKPVWCNYFAVFGIGKSYAYQLMPVVGSIDISLGILMLVYPLRAVAMWLVTWGLITAALRPVSGEAFAECMERAGNYGAPFVVLLLAGRKGNFFSRIQKPGNMGYRTGKQLKTSLQAIVFLLLLGHGWLNLIDKKGLLEQYAALGFSHPHAVAASVGILEMTAAFAVLAKPAGLWLLALFAWKASSELFYPHWELFEWIERGGSYGCILALWFGSRANFGILPPESEAPCQPSTSS